MSWRGARAKISPFLLLIMMVFPLAAEDIPNALNLALPTENDALYHGGGAEFYQQIKRDFRGVQSTPWEGGQYGFVRNPVETSVGVIFTRFHEGIDIRPRRRDARGEPLDPVRAIADGTVVYVNLVAAYSNYGRYVVVEHRWNGASYFSLYAHLASAVVRQGALLKRGQQLGVMGYTGEGLDRERAHVHLELNLLLSRNFEPWYEHFIKDDPNRHGIYNGVNLAGLDIARLFLALRKDPQLTIADFLAGEERFYRVRLPAAKSFDLAQRYPWLTSRAAGLEPPSWEVSFNRAGVPLKVEAGTQPALSPTLSFVKKSDLDYAMQTRGVVGGSGLHAHLTESGERLMELLIWPD